MPCPPRQTEMIGELAALAILPIFEPMSRGVSRRPNVKKTDPVQSSCAKPTWVVRCETFGDTSG